MRIFTDNSIKWISLKDILEILKIDCDSAYFDDDEIISKDSNYFLNKDGIKKLLTSRYIKHQNIVAFLQVPVVESLDLNLSTVAICKTLDCKYIDLIKDFFSDTALIKNFTFSPQCQVDLFFYDYNIALDLKMKKSENDQKFITETFQCDYIFCSTLDEKFDLFGIIKLLYRKIITQKNKIVNQLEASLMDTEEKISLLIQNLKE